VDLAGEKLPRQETNVILMESHFRKAGILADILAGLPLDHRKEVRKLAISLLVCQKSIITNEEKK
jgi:hypothetical protein